MQLSLPSATWKGERERDIEREGGTRATVTRENKIKQAE